MKIAKTGLAALFALSLSGAAGAASAAAPTPLSLKAFARDAEFANVQISPNGEYLAATVPYQDQTYLAILGLNPRKLLSAARFSAGQHVADFWWVAPDRVAMIMSERYGALETPTSLGELFAMNADGSRKTYLFGYRGNDRVGSHIRRGADKEYGWARMIDPLPLDPKQLLIGIDWWGNRNADFDEFAYVDKYSGVRSRSERAPVAGSSRFLADRKGEVRYVMTRDVQGKLQTHWRIQRSEPWQKDPASAQASAIIPLAFSADGHSVYLDSDEYGKSCLVRRDFGEREQRVPLACNAAASLVDVQYSLDGSEPISVSFADGSQQMLDTAHPDRPLLQALRAGFPGQTVRLVSSTLDGNRAVLLVHGDRNPGDFYLFDRRNKKAEYLMSRRSWIDPARMAERRRVTIAARDGYTLSGVLTLPQGVPAEQLPLVVNPHGGPFGVYDDPDWEADAQALASRGYAVLQVNFRGSGGYGAAHERAGHNRWGTLMIDDITDGARWAINQKIADPARLCIYGGSYGGYAALMSAVREPGLYRCVIGYAGVYDLEAWAQSTDVSLSDSGRAYIQNYVGADERALREQSPLSYLDRLKAPVLIVHGEKDRRVPFSQAVLLRSALDQRKHPYEWLAKPLEGHGFYREENRLELYEKLLAFLDRHIGRPHSP